MRSGRIETGAWIFAALIPFMTAFVLAAGASATAGTFYLQPSLATLAANFSLVTDSDAQTNIRASLFTSLWLSLACSIVTTALATGAGAALSRLRGSAWIVTSAFVGSRVVPVTAALPLFAMLIGVLRLPKGLFVIAVLYVLLFLPLAAALLSGARWQETQRAIGIINLDGALSLTGRAFLVVRSIGADIAIAAITVFLLCWSEFFLAAFLLQPGEVTIARYFSSFETINGYMWGPLGAAIVLSMIPAVIAIAAVGAVIRLRSGHSDEAGS